MTNFLEQGWAVIVLQIANFEAAKDWLVLALVGILGSFLGAAWADLRGQIRSLNARLDAKLEEDKTGYERLTRCEERLDALRGGRRDKEG